MDTDKDFVLDSIDCPPLAPEEHAWIEERVGRKLTTVEAQLALKDAKLAASWEWEAAKKGLQS